MISLKEIIEDVKTSSKIVELSYCFLVYENLVWWRSWKNIDAVDFRRATANDFSHLDRLNLSESDKITEAEEYDKALEHTVAAIEYQLTIDDQGDAREDANHNYLSSRAVDTSLDYLAARGFVLC